MSKNKIIKKNMEPSSLYKTVTRLRLSGAMRAPVYEKASALMEEGAGIVDALSEIHDRRLRSRGRMDPIVGMLKCVVYDISRKGRDFGEALSDFVPESEAMLISSGEKGGKLAKNMKYTAIMLRGISKAINAMLTSLVYPMLLFGLSSTILYMVGTKIVPEILRMVPFEKWSGASLALYYMSRVITSGWIWIVCGGLLALIVAVALSLSYWRGWLRVYADRIPPWSFYRILVGSSWLLSVATAVRAGEIQHQTIAKMAKRCEKSNPWLYERLRAVLLITRSGNKSLGDALAEASVKADLFGLASWQCYFNFPDLEVVEDLSLYTRLSSSDEAMETIGRRSLDMCLYKVMMVTTY